MKRILLIGCVLYPLLTAPAHSSDRNRFEALRQEAGDGYVIYESDHFLIAHHSTPEVLEMFVERVEYIYDSIQSFCDNRAIPHKPIEHKLEIIFFESHDSFVKYLEKIGAGSLNAAGMYMHDSRRSIFYDFNTSPSILQLNEDLADLRDIHRLARDKNRKKEVADAIRKIEGHRDTYIELQNQSVLQHETAHQVLFNLSVHNQEGANPTWLVEGMACIFETPPQRRGAGRFVTNQARLSDFRGALTTKSIPSSNNYDQAVEGKVLLPIPSLVSKTGNLTHDGLLSSTYYAQAWSMVWFLQKTRKEKFAAYINEVANRDSDREYSEKEEVALFEKHFGPVNKLEDRWLRYILKLPVKPYQNLRYGKRG